MRLLGPALAALLFLVDRLTKGYFLGHTNEVIQIWPNWLWLQFTLNEQMALSLPLFPILYYTGVSVILLVLSWLIVLNWQRRHDVVVTLIGCIMVGALSNLLDRLLYGGVIDFIVVRFGSVFNVADMIIVGAVVIWMFVLQRQDRHRLNNRQPNHQADVQKTV